MLTPAAEGMAGAVRRAEQILAETENAWMPQQFENRPTRRFIAARQQSRSGRTQTAQSTFWCRASEPGAPSPAPARY